MYECVWILDAIMAIRFCLFLFLVFLVDVEKVICLHLEIVVHQVLFDSNISTFARSQTTYTSCLSVHHHHHHRHRHRYHHQHQQLLCACFSSRYNPHRIYRASQRACSIICKIYGCSMLIKPFIVPSHHTRPPYTSHTFERKKNA